MITFKLPYPPTTHDRFWSKVDASDGPDACWPWIAARDPNGYGRVTGFASTVASRVAWMLVHGRPSRGQVVRHRCDNPPCCNPAHLEIGSMADNQRDAAERNRMRFGEGSPVAVLTAEKVARIREMAAERKISQAQIGKLFGINQSHVSAIHRGVIWSKAAT